MAKTKTVSSRKRVSIISHAIRNLTIKGKYFNHKPKDVSNLLGSLRSFGDIDFSYLLNEFEKFSLPINIPGSKRTSLKDLTKDILEFKNFDSEFYWAKNILTRKIPQINKFLSLSAEYSVNILNGDYNEAEKILGQVEYEFGYSIWLVQNKIAFLQIAKGLEEQKKFLQLIKKEVPNGSLSRFLFHWTSVRNESQISINRFKVQVESHLNKIDSEKLPGFKEYLSYHLLSENLDNAEAMIQIVRLSYSDSIIDYYLAFVRLLASMLNSSNEIFIAKVSAFLSQFGDKFDDPKLKLLNGLLKSDIALDCKNIDMVQLYDEILKRENLENVIERLQMHLLTGNSLPINLMLQSLAISQLDIAATKELHTDTALKDKIVFNLSEILQRGTIDASKEFSDLGKIVLNFSDFSWASSTKILLYKESPPTSISTTLIYNVIDCEILHPLLMNCIENNRLKSNYQLACENLYGENLSTIFHVAFETGSDKRIPLLGPSFDNYLNASINFHRENYEVAIRFARILCSEKNGYFVRRGYSIISHSYLNQNDLRMVVISIADCYLLERNFYPFLPVQEVVQLIKPGTTNWNLVGSLIEFSIVLDIYFKHYNKKIEVNRRFAYEDFLNGLELKRPSQLRGYLHKIETSKLVYYLRHICVEPTMDTSSAFADGSNEVLKERLEVCRLLTDIDSRNESIYKKEINEIVRRQVINDRRQEVDQSRIYLDVKSIKEWAEIELEESYARYISFLKLGLENKAIKVIHQNEDSRSIMITPEDEISAVFEYMIEEIRKAYLSADMGLDRFISTRIRHGELERTMRIPIQNHNLITKKVSKNGPYKPNSSWLNKLNDTGERVKLDKAFKKFSENYDNLIAKIANEWLQIKRSDRPQGLFDFTLYEDHIQRLTSTLSLDTTLPEFIDSVITLLDQILILILVKIRDVLNGKGKLEAKNLLILLQNEINSCSGGSILELQRAINLAKTDLSAQFDKIIEWFTPSAEGNSSPYVIEDAIYVAEAIIKEATPSFKLNLFTNEENEFAIHGQLPIFVDIFINIFENVVKRSGLDLPIADVEIEHLQIEDDLFRINIRISNELGQYTDVTSLNGYLLRIRTLLHEGKYTELLASEVNSGLLKIHRSVKDFSANKDGEKPVMDFYVVNNRFEIYLSIPFDIFVLQQENIETYNHDESTIS